MPDVKNILVGVDLSHGDHLISAELSPESLGAIAQATELAARRDARLTFYAVIDLDPHTLSYLELEDQNALKNLGNQAEEVLQGLVASAKEQGVADVRAGHAFGKSWVELTKQVLRGQHDLLMAGTRGLSGLQRLLLGSTGLKLMRNCPCPVWITKPHVTAPLCRVLVADDLTEIGAKLVKVGALVAAAKNAELHVLHALEYPWDSSTTGTDPKRDAYRERARRHASELLARHLDCPEVKALASPPRVVLREELGENAILDYVPKQQIDLLVMATIARSGISGFLMGNTAERLMPQLSCSVLAIKPDDFRSPVTLDT
jgi:universal stress protein E